MTSVDQALESVGVLQRNPFRDEVRQSIRRLTDDKALPREGYKLEDWKEWVDSLPATIHSLVEPDALALSLCVGVGAGVPESERHERIVEALSWLSRDVQSRVPEMACRSLHVRDALQRIVGNSAAMRTIRAQGWTAAFGDDLLAAQGLEAMLRATPVLILGETGTGKELLAQSLCGAAPGQWSKKKGWSPSKNDSVNLAALPEDLILSALFGHKKGAFTGAAADHDGVLAKCNDGAVFLDEVADLSMRAQVALLRALQEGVARPLGGDTDVPAAPRIISATHIHLAARAAEGRFRMDLYYRLSAAILVMPPLRDRLEDIEPLVGSVLDSIGQELRPLVKERFTGFLQEHGAAHSWPGNVRELRAVVQALCLGLQPRLDRTIAGPEDVVPRQMLDCAWTLDEVRRWYANRTVRTVDNKTEAAKRLDVDRGTLRKLLDGQGGAK